MVRVKGLSSPAASAYLSHTMEQALSESPFRTHSSLISKSQSFYLLFPITSNHLSIKKNLTEPFGDIQTFFNDKLVRFKTFRRNIFHNGLIWPIFDAFLSVGGPVFFQDPTVLRRASPWTLAFDLHSQPKRHGRLTAQPADTQQLLHSSSERQLGIKRTSEGAIKPT